MTARVGFRRMFVAVALCGSLGLSFSGCCFGGTGGGSVAPLPPSPVVAPSAPPAPTAAQTIMAGGGLTPDPTVTTGVGGGPLSGQTLHPSCFVGSYPGQPQLNVTVTAPMAYLGFVVSSDADLTMAVRRPDGSFNCDDDGGVGVNPLFHEAAVPGDYSIFVGSFGGSHPAPYTLAVTTLPAVDASIAGDTALLHGQLRVLSATGGLPIAVGSLCDYVQVAIPPRPNGLDVRWRVRCGDTLVYGNGRSESSGGFQYRTRPDWPAGTLINDAATSASDQDPTFVWNSSQIHIADDDQGYAGVAYDLTLAQVE